MWGDTWCTLPTNAMIDDLSLKTGENVTTYRTNDTNTSMPFVKSKITILTLHCELTIAKYMIRCSFLYDKPLGFTQFQLLLVVEHLNTWRYTNVKYNNTSIWLAEIQKLSIQTSSIKIRGSDWLKFESAIFSSSSWRATRTFKDTSHEQSRYSTTSRVIDFRVSASERLC